MHINLQHKFEPFSHEFGSECLLPHTSLSFQVYPSKIIIKDIFNSVPQVIGILTNNLAAPIEKFLVSCDLEKGIIKVEGKSLDGFFRFFFLPLQGYKGFILKCVKSPQNFLWNYEGYLNREDKEDHMIFYGESINPYSFSPLEKLFLGISKKQDWDLVKRRSLMEEILPFWFYMGQMYPNYPADTGSSLFDRLICSIINRDKTNVIKNFKSFFKSGFDGILVPRLHDEDFQGFNLPAICSKTPFSVLASGYEAIRMMFFQGFNDAFHILPCLPPELHHGRLIHIQTQYGTIDLEWTKKTIRRMIFRCNQSCSLSFIFQKKIKQYRLNHQVHDSCCQHTFEEHSIYYFDNFKM